MKYLIKKEKLLLYSISIVVFILFIVFVIEILKYFYVRPFISEIKYQYENSYKMYEEHIHNNVELSYKDILPEHILTAIEDVEKNKKNVKIRDKYYFLEESIDVYSDFKLSSNEIILKLKVIPINIKIKSLDKVKMQLRCKEMVYVFNKNEDNYKSYNLEDFILEVELIKNDDMWNPTTFYIGEIFGKSIA